VSAGLTENGFEWPDAWRTIVKAGEFCNREVVVIEKDASVAEAAALMRKYHVGSVVVVDALEGARKPVGVLTDRDIVLEFVARDFSPAEVSAGDAAGHELVTVDEEAGLFETIEIMRDHGVRRLPVINSGGGLVGLVASDDALELLAEQLSYLVRLVGRQQRQESERRS
jgi:CBS domain-containing protein